MENMAPISIIFSTTGYFEDVKRCYYGVKGFSILYVMFLFLLNIELSYCICKVFNELIFYSIEYLVI